MSSHMAISNRRAKFKAEQLAGSCRIEGITVTRSEQQVMVQIIKGEADTDAMKARLRMKYARKTKRPQVIVIQSD